MPPVFIPIGLALGATASTAAVVGGTALALGVGVVGSSIYKAQATKTAAKKAAGAAENQYRQQQAQVAKLEAKENEAVVSAEKTKVRNEARVKQQRLAASASGRRNTILTSPLGIAGSGATGQRKTLLGT